MKKVHMEANTMITHCFIVQIRDLKTTRNAKMQTIKSNAVLD
jgi:hypothetical protein